MKKFQLGFSESSPLQALLIKKQGKRKSHKRVGVKDGDNSNAQRQLARSGTQDATQKDGKQDSCDNSEEAGVAGLIMPPPPPGEAFSGTVAALPVPRQFSLFGVLFVDLTPRFCVSWK